LPFITLHIKSSELFFGSLDFKFFKHLNVITFYTYKMLIRIPILPHDKTV